MSSIKFTLDNWAENSFADPAKQVELLECVADGTPINSAVVGIENDDGSESLVFVVWTFCGDTIIETAMDMDDAMAYFSKIATDCPAWLASYRASKTGTGGLH